MYDIIILQILQNLQILLHPIDILVYLKSLHIIIRHSPQNIYISICPTHAHFDVYIVENLWLDILQTLHFSISPICINILVNCLQILPLYILHNIPISISPIDIHLYIDSLDILKLMFLDNFHMAIRLTDTNFLCIK